MMESVPVDAVDSGLESALVLSLLWSVMVDVVSVTQPPMTMLLAVFVARHDDPLSFDLPTEYRLLKLMDFGRNSMTTTAYTQEYALVRSLSGLKSDYSYFTRFLMLLAWKRVCSMTI